MFNDGSLQGITTDKNQQYWRINIMLKNGSQWLTTKYILSVTGLALRDYSDYYQQYPANTGHV